jgi:hypothetical protein
LRRTIDTNESFCRKNACFAAFLAILGADFPAGRSSSRLAETFWSGAQGVASHVCVLFSFRLIAEGSTQVILAGHSFAGESIIARK